MREITMSSRMRWIGRAAGLTAVSALVVLASCGRTDSGEQAASEQSAALVPTASAAPEAEKKAPEPVRASAETKPASAAPAPRDTGAVDGPRLRLGSLEHDFGKIYDTGPQVCRLTLTNVGNMPLTVQKISTSCGCTTANKSEVEGRPIPPGESRNIEITYKPKATSSKVTKVVTIQSDDFIEPVQRFKVSAQLIEPARLDPPRYQMGQIRSGEGHRTTFTVISPDPKVEILSIESDDEFLSFEVFDEASENPDFPGRKRIEASISEKIPSGPVRMNFTIKTRAAAEEGETPVESELTGMILGHVRGELTNNPRFLRIRNVAAGEVFEAKTMLYSEQGRPFKVTSTRLIDSTIDDVTVEVTAMEPYENDEPGYWITVRGTLPQDAKGAFQGKVLVETDIPNESEKAIIFNGIVRRDIPGQARPAS